MRACDRRVMAFGRGVRVSGDVVKEGGEGTGIAVARFSERVLEVWRCGQVGM